ncbi:MAG: hypothetical protein ACI4OB_03350 [Christensenellales bacterium]
MYNLTFIFANAGIRVYLTAQNGSRKRNIIEPVASILCKDSCYAGLLSSEAE